jgi:RsiW-degrading membrane proteinase PrsW (M82 family)
VLALRTLFVAVLPAVVAAYALWWGGERRESGRVAAGTFVLGALCAVPAFYLQVKASAWTGLDVRTSVAGNAGALLFQFALVSPVRELAKVVATWPAFRSKYFDRKQSGVVFAAAASMGFAAYEGAWHFWRHPGSPGLWTARVLLALPAHLFFGGLWGYALGRVVATKRPDRVFGTTWVAATVGDALYTHFVYGRGPGALVAAVPMLLAMGLIAVLFMRDLDAKPREAPAPTSRSPLSIGPPRRSSRHPPSLRAVRDALRRADRPIMLGWIALGTVVTIGAMLVGLAAAVAFGHYAHVDFGSVDEHDVSTTAPVALLGAGILAAFPLSGFLVARASGVATLLEPALSAGLAILAALVLLGLAAPIAMVFALAFSPIALALACAGAWVGRVVE